jgi:GT2 family glycosyltransferase
VVVVTWRGAGFVGRCLDALAAQTVAHELLVVDNASTDGTRAVLAGHRSRPRAVRLPANRGYAGGLAAALPLVRTPYVAWLNDDAEPAPCWLAELESALDAVPEAAAAAALLLSPVGAVQSAGVRLTARGYGADVTEPPQPGRGGVGVPGAVFGFCGGAALVRTAELRAAGGVPAAFFCYYEDTDTAWRLRLRGHQVLSVPAARVTHRHGASSSIGSPTFHRCNERNRLLMLLRCAPAGVAAIELARFVASTVVSPLRRRRSGPVAPNHRPLLRLRVLAAVAVRLAPTLAQRAAIGRRSVLRRRDVWRVWAGAAGNGGS